MISRLLSLILLVLPVFMKAQEKAEEDPFRLIREVIEVQVEKPKVTAPPPAPEPETKGKKGKKKQEEPVIEEPPQEETGTMPAPVSELMKRADSWTKTKSKKFAKTNVTNSGSTISCVAVFIYKPKELNPICDVEGEISMDIIIECKEGKYRYTIKNIRHSSRNPNVNGGDVYNPIPECGTIPLNDLAWKQIKGDALRDAGILAQDLKARMSLPGEEKKDEW